MHRPVVSNPEKTERRDRLNPSASNAASERSESLSQQVALEHATYLLVVLTQVKLFLRCGRNGPLRHQPQDLSVSSKHVPDRAGVDMTFRDV